MHLSWSARTYQGKTYKYWHLAESVRVGSKVKKKIIVNLGPLPDEKVKQLKMICKTLKNDNDTIVSLDNIEILNALDYLELAVANAIWDRWQLDDAFKNDITSSDLDTLKIARILALNRCTFPKSHHAIVRWIKRTALPEILRIDPLKITDDKLYYELDKIEKNKCLLEYTLFKKTHEKDPGSYDFINYDLTSSYFVGIQCNLSWYGRSKDKRPDYKQVVLGMMINKKGYPFKWDVYPGNQAESETLKRNIQGCIHRFGLKEVTLVFDRGLVSKENLSFIQDRKAKLKYISALDRSQVESVTDDQLKLFRDIETDRQKLKKSYKKCLPGFSRTKDKKFYYKDLGVEEETDKRYILSFNPTLCEETRRIRQQKLDSFLSALNEINDDLLHAKRDRTLKGTKNKVQKLVDTSHLKKFVDKIDIKSITISRKYASGKPRKIKSYQVSVPFHQDKLDKQALLDGVCVLVTNHTQKRRTRFLLSPEEIISAYNHKASIENAFKHVKSFLKIRPFHVNLDQHVKAVYTICVLAYFINVHLARLRESINGEERFLLNSSELYDPFRSCKLVQLVDTATGLLRKCIVKPTKEQLDILKALKLHHLLELNL